MMVLCSGLLTMAAMVDGELGFKGAGKQIEARMLCQTTSSFVTNAIKSYHHRFVKMLFPEPL